MSDLSIEILRQIRDELRALRTELSSRIDDTNEHLERIDRRQTEGELRLATELVAVAGAVNTLRDVLLQDREIRKDVLDHEKRIAALERKLG